jgi:hypothetical protein
MDSRLPIAMVLDNLSYSDIKNFAEAMGKADVTEYFNSL